MEQDHGAKRASVKKSVFGALTLFISFAFIVTGAAVGILIVSRPHERAGVKVVHVAAAPLAFGEFFVDGEAAKSGETVPGFVFASPQSDREGRVIWDGETSEKMSLTLSGVIGNADRLGAVSYTLALPDGVIAAAKKGYLDLSRLYDGETESPRSVALSLTDDGELLPDGSWKFAFEVSILWGEAFVGVNPSIFYDTAGAHIPLEEVTATLDDFRETVNRGGARYTLTVRAETA